MLKIFSTQISGLFKKIIDNEDINIEDAARLLSQAAIGEGSIYIHGVDEMQGVVSEALHGIEPFPKAKPFHTVAELSSTDRVLLFSRTSTAPNILALATELEERHIPFVAVSTSEETEGPSLANLADVHIDLRIQKGLIPDDVGNRYGFPTLLVALFAYYGIKFTIEEIIQEYEEDF